MRRNVRVAIGRLQYSSSATSRRNFKGNPLHNRTGKLVNSIAVAPIEKTRRKFPALWARTHNLRRHPGTLEGLSMRRTLPTSRSRSTAVLLAAGVARYTARQLIESKGAVGGFTGTFFRNGVLFGSNKGQVTPCSLWKSSVTLPARPYMVPGLAETRGDAEKALAAAMDAALAGREL